MKIYFEKEAKFFFNFGWSHGRYLDYWSFVHVFTGIIIGLGILMFKLPSFISIVIVALGLTFYEFLEMIARVAEDVQNVISDIILGTGSAALIVYYLMKIVSYHDLFIITPLFIILNLLCIYTGWGHYLKKQSTKSGTYTESLRALYFIYTVGIFATLISLTYWIFKL